MLVHRNLIANMQQVAAWYSTVVKLGEEIMITALPLYHIFALTCNCLVFMKFGGLNVLITNPRGHAAFRQAASARGSPRSPASTRCSMDCCTPRDSTSSTSSTMRMSMAGGMAVQRAVAERWKQVTAAPCWKGSA
jgi:long-chain acyl-CoA synthetase